MSFLPNISPGNVRQRLPASLKLDDNIRWDRPSEWLDLGINAAYGTDTVPEKIKGLAAVFPNDIAPAANYVAFNLDTNDGSNILVDWGDGNPAETTHESDFSSDVDGYTGDSHGSVSRVASHNGENDVLLYQSSGGRDGIKNVSVPLYVGNAYTLTFDYYADSSFSGVWGVQYSFANVISMASNFPTIVTGAWTSVSLTIPATRPTGSYTTLRIRPQADANSVYGNGGTGDQIGFRNIKVVANNSGSGYYYTEDTTVHHVYDYDAITTTTSTAKATPFKQYKQAIFEVTLTGSAKFGNINFVVDGPFVSYSSYASRRGSSILDLFVSSSGSTRMDISDNRPLQICEQIEVRNTSSNRLTTPRSIYSGAKCLQSIPFVPWIYNAGTRDYLYAFAYCHSLKFLPDDFASTDKYWFKNSTRFQQAFDTCYDLQYLPEGLFGDSIQSSCSNFYLMFRDCRKLKYIPYIGVRTGSGSDTRVDYMFNNCLSLEKIPEGSSLQRMSNAGIDRVFQNNRKLKNWSALFDGTTDVLGAINYTGNTDMTLLFSGLQQLLEFPFVGQFTKCNDSNSIFLANPHVERYSSEYTHLDFSNTISLSSAWNGNYKLRELPEIKVRNLSETNSTYQTFYTCRNLRAIKFTGMIGGAANGEYYRMFNGCASLACIDGVDFSFATETSDYHQMFHSTRNINAIKFPGTFRAGYASPRINVAVANHTNISGEYHITADGTGYDQASGNGELRVAESGGNYTWTIKDSSDETPTESSSASSSTQFTPHSADWSGATNAVTFTEVETGFKYTVTGNSGDGLKYSPIKRAQMLEIFNQLVTVSHSATIDIQFNTYTKDLTANDIAIATDKGWTVINNEGTFNT